MANPFGPCRKCGQQGLAVEWIPPQPVKMLPFGDRVIDFQEVMKDYLEITCQTCGFKWRVAPLDRIVKEQGDA